MTAKQRIIQELQNRSRIDQRLTEAERRLYELRKEIKETQQLQRELKQQRLNAKQIAEKVGTTHYYVLNIAKQTYTGI